MRCSCGKVPSPNEGNVYPFTFPPLGRVLTTHERRWEVGAEDTSMELLWSGVGVAQADPCTVRVFNGYKGQTHREQPGVARRGKLLAAFLLRQPSWMPEQMGKGSIQHHVGAPSV